MGPFRIVVVDDSALFRTILRNAIAEIPQCEVVASVADGKAAVDKIAELKPDLVTLDLEMPGFTGLDVLRELKRRRIRSKVLMVSRFTTAGARVTTDALIEGAFDFVLKPSGSNPTENKSVLRAELQEKIDALRNAASETDEVTVPAMPRAPLTSHGRRVDAVVIGCSTGGPDALARIIPDLPVDFPVPVFIVQHMPAGFTASLAARLYEASELEVQEAADGMAVQRGRVILARGGQHLHLERLTPANVVVRLTDAPPEHRCRPAVDYTLRSAAEVYHGHLLVVILTGMGRDGTAGCKLVASLGGSVMVQHPDGCVVYGMPKSVAAAGLANLTVPLPKIAASISQWSARS